MKLIEAWLSLLPLGVEWSTHLWAIRASHCSSPCSSCVGSLIVVSSTLDVWYFAAPYKLLHFPQNSNAVSVACLLSFRDPISSTFGTAHMLEHCQDWLQSRTMDSLPRQTPGVLLWLDCSWVCSNRQDHTRFLTPSIKHHRTAIFCHTRHPHIFLPAKLRMSNHKTSEVQDFERTLFLIFDN